MTRARERIRTAAAAGGWDSQRLNSIKGGIYVEFFARQRLLVEVRYDVRGRIIEAFKRTFSLAKGTPRVIEHLTSRDSDKPASIVSWLQTR